MRRRLCLITGASAGIGAAFARLYAAQGYDLALTARRRDRLEQLAAALRAAHGVEVLTIAADLAEPGAVDHILAAVAAKGRTIDALVNNAGYGLAGAYAATRWSDQQAFLQVLLISVCELTHRVLPGMVARGFGRILNVASLAGLVPGLPSHTLYGPTKALLIKFSQGLHGETLNTGVHVCALCPGFTRSEFHDVNGTRSQTDRIPAWLWQDAETVARTGHAAVEANRAVAVSGAPNRLIAALCRLVPDDWLLGLLLRQARKFRQL